MSNSKNVDFVVIALFYLSLQCICKQTRKNTVYVIYKSFLFGSHSMIISIITEPRPGIFSAAGLTEYYNLLNEFAM